MMIFHNIKGKSFCSRIPLINFSKVLQPWKMEQEEREKKSLANDVIQKCHVLAVALSLARWRRCVCIALMMLPLNNNVYYTHVCSFGVCIHLCIQSVTHTESKVFPAPAPFTSLAAAA
jgi:hypothetical protein